MSALPDASRVAFEAWAKAYALRSEPNYSKYTEADCLAAWQASRKQALEEAAKVCEGAANKSRNSLFRSGTNICAGLIKELLK